MVEEALIRKTPERKCHQDLREEDQNQKIMEASQALVDLVMDFNFHLVLVHSHLPSSQRHLVAKDRLQHHQDHLKQRMSSFFPSCSFGLHSCLCFGF
ncbi:hypothetical protein pdam_00025065 [Pocillopora damicornis]|uniref:Uncharacterized protein n=1 Tax=Pocillopora damicornis TaxID=46731 RepID=A0A3M6U793_POCDA|nr:hypothetical protein pdam_00025065 [Pocillopora damicornis]